MLEKEHSIDCILLLYLKRGRWRDANAFIQKMHLTMGDKTFYARMKELQSLGFAKSIAINSRKKYYVKTNLCNKVARLLLEFFDKVAKLQ
jgi:hypothetical protein